MPTILTAANCPLPIANTTLNKLSDAYNALGTSGAQVFSTIAQGTTNLAAKFNKNALATELIGRRGCGVYCITNGLDLSHTSGLTVNVAAGQALIDGIVEISTATTYVVPDATARVYIWLKQDSTLTHATTTSPPTGGKVFLGSCVTAGGTVTSLDDSGVLRSYGGLAVRTTADTGTPGDTPPSSLVFLTKTSNGAYLWRGDSYAVAFTPTELQESVEDIVGAMFTNTTGLTWTYNDGTGKVSAAFDLTAFTTDSLPEGAGNYYFTDARARAAVLAQQREDPLATTTATADVTLSTTSKNIQAVIASGANRSVLLPATPTFAMWFKVWNIGTSNSVIVKSSDGSSAIVTLAASQYAMIDPAISTGSPAWPATATASSPGTPL